MNNKKNVIKKVIILIIAVCILAGLYNGLRITRIEYKNIKIPKEFDGYKIIQISDLHSTAFGKSQSKLIENIQNENPDLIVITGDMYDKKRWNYDNIKNLLEGISDIAPIYAVTGNNEYDDVNMYKILQELYDEYNVTLLEDEYVEIAKEESKIYLHGLYYRTYILQKNTDLEGIPNQFNILLYHDPSQFDKLSLKGVDLILAGHTHGGIIRVPFLGGIIGNDGIVFPEYDYGMYFFDTCSMYVSTGLGNTDVPRFNNRPELVVFTLKSQ